MLLYGLALRGGEVLQAMKSGWRTGVGGGIMQVASYGVAIWAMTVAPIAIVGAVRESSVLFGTAIAVVFLKEPVLASRIVAASMIVTALILIRLD